MAGKPAATCGVCDLPARLASLRMTATRDAQSFCKEIKAFKLGMLTVELAGFPQIFQQNC